MRGKKNNEIQKQHILTKLVPILQRTGNLYRACLIAKIPRSTVVSIREKDPLFDEAITLAEIHNILQAEDNISNAIKEGDVDVSKWLLERKLKSEYGNKQRIELDAVIAGSQIQFTKKQEEDRRQRAMKIVGKISNKYGLKPL